MKKNTQFLTVDELCERWQVDYPDIFYLIKNKKLKWDNELTLAGSDDREIPVHEFSSKTQNIISSYSEEFGYLNLVDGVKIYQYKDLIAYYLLSVDNLVKGIPDGQYYFKRREIENFEKKQAELIHARPDAHLAFFDLKNKYYSKELDIAVKAWQALFGEGGIYKKGKLSVKKQIENWLKKNYGKLSSNAIERITTLINPNKRGGAPPTE